MRKWRMFWNPRCGFRIPGTGHRIISLLKLGLWIPKTRIPHSTSKNLLLFGFPHKNSLDSGIRISLHGRLNIPPFGIFYKKKLFPFSLTSTLILSLFYCLMVRQKNCWKQHQKQQQIRKIKRRRRLIWHKNPEALQSMLRREGGRGGGAWNLAPETQVCWGRGLRASSPRTLWNIEARKWYSQHSQ